MNARAAGVLYLYLLLIEIMHLYYRKCRDKYSWQCAKEQMERAEVLIRGLLRGGNGVQAVHIYQQGMAIGYYRLQE